jgi:hypothetical protein
LCGPALILAQGAAGAKCQLADDSSTGSASEKVRGAERGASSHGGEVAGHKPGRAAGTATLRVVNWWVFQAP